MTTKKKVTAAELMRKLQADPAFVAKRAQKGKEREKLESEWRRAERPLVEELQRAGFEVESAWDLVNTSAAYPKALPILVDHLQRTYPGPVREGIARALAVPEAKFGWDVLMRLYRDEHEKRAKDGLAVAIAAVADDELIEDVIALARDTRHGTSRLLLLNALECSPDPRARAALMELGTDSELAKEIQVILQRLRRSKR
jgi:HEAT repeat protein